MSEKRKLVFTKEMVVILSLIVLYSVFLITIAGWFFYKGLNYSGGCMLIGLFLTSVVTIRMIKWEKEEQAQEEAEGVLFNKLRK